MPDAPIEWTFELRAKEGRTDELEAKLQELIEHLEQTEPGMLSYNVFRSPDGSSYQFHERYESEEAAVAHMTGDAPNVFLPKLLESSEIGEFHIFGSPGEKLTEVLSNFPVTATHERVTGFDR